MNLAGTLLEPLNLTWNLFQALMNRPETSLKET